MVNIEVDKRTRAGKALIETARRMAMKYKGIYISEENSLLISRIAINDKKDLLSESDKMDFLKELHKISVNDF